MFATLNLQLSTVELLADTNLTPAAALPEDTVAPESGFAQLLSLRIDAGLASEDADGEFLPQGGSGLPLGAGAATDDVLPESQPTPVIDVQPIQPEPGYAAEGEGARQSDTVDLVLETPVIYPPPASRAAGAAALPNPVSPVPAPLVPAAVPLSTRPPEDAARHKPGAEGLQDLAIKPGPRPDPLADVRQATPAPAVDAPQTRARRAAAEFVMPPAGLGLRERGQPGEPLTRAAPIAVSDTAIDHEQRMRLADPGRRLDLTTLQRADGRLESGTDVPPARIAVPQATQTLQAQINTQPSQPTLPPAASAAGAADVSFAAPAQQGTDLIGTSVRDSAWREQIGERVVVMAGNQLKQAEIRLTPAELGPLKVQVSVDDGAAHVTFHAQHAVTREALEQALPRLREMLAENGLSLGQADVSDRGVGEGNRERESDGGLSKPATEDLPDAGIDSAQGSARRLSASNGLVDTFA